MSILGTDGRARLHNCIGYAAVFALALSISGCGGGGLFGRSDGPAATGATASSPSIGDRFSGLFSSGPAAQTQTPGSVGISSQDVDCPTVDIRPGTSTYAVSTVGVDPSALSLRYQASFGQTARECKLAGNMLTIRVGVEGRVVVGPAGGPGQVEIPVRYAVVQEGPEPKTIVTKVQWQKITIPPGEPHVPFTQIEEQLTFEMPRGNNLDAYVVYIGFDRAAIKQPEKKAPAKKPPPLRRGT